VKQPILGVTMGDPAGVGPEIIVKAAAELSPRIQNGELRLVVIGSNRALEMARSQFAMRTICIAVRGCANEAPRGNSRGSIPAARNVSAAAITTERPSSWRRSRS